MKYLWRKIPVKYLLRMTYDKIPSRVIVWPPVMDGFVLKWLQCTLNFDPILDEIFREWSVVTAVYYVVTAIPKLRNIWSFRALAAFWVSLWSTSVCQAVAAVHSVVRRLHRGLTQRHSHNNIKHHSISSNIQFRLSTKASLTIIWS